MILSYVIIKGSVTDEDEMQHRSSDAGGSSDGGFSNGGSSNGGGNGEGGNGTKNGGKGGDKINGSCETPTDGMILIVFVLLMMFVESNNEEENTNGDTNDDTNEDTNGGSVEQANASSEQPAAKPKGIYYL